MNTRPVWSTTAALGQPHSCMQESTSHPSRCNCNPDSWMSLFPGLCHDGGHGQAKHPHLCPAILWLIAVPTNTPAQSLQDTTNSFFCQKRGAQRPIAAPHGCCVLQRPGVLNHTASPLHVPTSPLLPATPGALQASQSPALPAAGRVAMEKISVPLVTQRKLCFPELAWDAALMRRRRRRVGKGLALFLSFALYF